jgi:hypothetical protein
MQMQQQQMQMAGMFTETRCVLYNCVNLIVPHSNRLSNASYATDGSNGRVFSSSSAYAITIDVTDDSRTGTHESARIGWRTTTDVSAST